MSEQIVPVHFKGVAEAEFQAEIRAALLQLLVDASQNRGFRLDLLEGITAAVDFPKAVEDFETGYSDDRGATRETVAGRMLMAARKEGIRGHVFLPATTALDLVITESPTYGSSAYTSCTSVRPYTISQFDNQRSGKQCSTTQFLRHWVIHCRSVGMSMQYAD
jgi:hypothetical protein